MRISNLSRAFLASYDMIHKAEKRLEDAIKDQDWQGASEIESYISGMNQIKAVFEQTVKKEDE